MSILSSSRSVLILGDEGLSIYKVTRGTSSYVASLEWSKSSFERDVKALLQKECSKLPVLMINDMVEQHYRKEELPKISPLDKASVVKRRLSIAFPNYPIRAALKLKAGGAKKPGSGGTFLFAAMPQSDAYKKTMSAIKQAGVGVVGMNLLPVEGSAMVKALSQKLAGKDGAKAKWSVFLGQHHGGGLRQVVTKDGELALTRMTPIVDTDVEPELWVKEVSSELQSTMSYLGRFGYKPADGLNIFIVASQECKDLLEKTISLEANVKCVLASNVASTLGVGVAKVDDGRYADPVYAAWIASQRSFVLPMQNPDIEKEVRPRQIAMGLSALLFAGACFTGYQSFVAWGSVEENQNKLSLLQQQKQSVQVEYNKTLTEAKIPGYDLLLVNNSINLYRELPDTTKSLLSVFQKISEALSPQLRLSSLFVKLVPVKKGAPDPFAPPSVEVDNRNLKKIEIVTKISFSANVKVEPAIQAIDGFRDNLERALPGFDVDILKQVRDLSYTGNVVGETTSRVRGASEAPQDFSAEIRIREKSN